MCRRTGSCCGDICQNVQLCKANHGENHRQFIETLRKVVESDGKLVLQLTESGELIPNWSSRLCVGPDGRSLVYLSSDGFMVPLITNDEKITRREKVVHKRRHCGKKRQPLPPRKKGTDQEV